MDPRYHGASLSPTRVLAALLQGVFSATVLPAKVKRARALPPHVALTGALALALCLLALVCSSLPVPSLRSLARESVLVKYRALRRPTRTPVRRHHHHHPSRAGL
jgi:hypothetical protein